MELVLDIKHVPTFVLENWLGANRFVGNLRFYYNGTTFTIQQARQELAERRKNDD